jgi:hypothetical protein
MGQSATPYLYILGKIAISTTYSPFVAKHSPTDLTVQYATYSTLTASTSSVSTPFPARLAVCETLGYFFYAQNKDGLQKTI